MMPAWGLLLLPVDASCDESRPEDAMVPADPLPAVPVPVPPRPSKRDALLAAPCIV